MTEGFTQYAAHRGEGSGDLGPLHMNVLNVWNEPVMCKAHTGDAYCIAAASDMYQVTCAIRLSNDRA